MDSDQRSKWLRALFICSAILCGLLVSPLAFAEEPIQVTANTLTFVFGQQVRFHLQVTSDAPIQSIVLAYRTSDIQGTTVETMAFDAGTTVSVDYVHEIERRYIRPFVEITYWWTIGNTSGAKLTTEPQAIAYADNRFDWQTLTDGLVNVRWYEGELKVAQQALDVAVVGLNRARQDVHVDSVRKPIDVYLYASADDLRPALPAGLPLGAEALTLYETNVVLVPIGPEGANIPHLKRILPHEVTHALIHEATETDFDRVPFWLAEGLATSVEYTFAPDPSAQPLLENELREGKLIPLDTLCAAFPHDLARARLAYVESANVVNYIRDMYGRQALRDLVSAYADGATCEGGVQRVLGFSLERLETLWRENLAPRSNWVAFWEDSGAWMVLLILFAGFPLFFVRSPRAMIPALRKKVR